MKSNSTLGKIFGYMGIAVISIGVMLFLGKHSLNFFINTFQAEDALFAYLGLLLTSGGAVIWMGIFVWNANTHLRRAIALIMMIVALAGEMVTAVFDMQNAALYASGFQFLPEELKQMTDLIGYLGAFTGLMLIIYSIGDLIFAAFKDDDSDGTINLLDPVDNRTGEATKGIVWPWSNKKYTSTDKSRQIYYDPDGNPILEPWDIIDHKSEYALPCGHIRGTHNNPVTYQYDCNVCNKPINPEWGPSHPDWRGQKAAENKNGQHAEDPTNQPRQ